MGHPVESLKTDNSWGCTIRCLQMLLANALYKTDIKPAAIRSPGEHYDSLSEQQKRVINILGLFNSDKRADGAPFSI